VKGTKLGIYKLGEGAHNRLGEGERKVRLGQDSLPIKPFPSRKLAESTNVVLPSFLYIFRSQAVVKK
jgi:hypothetical protein